MCDVLFVTVHMCDVSVFMVQGDQKSLCTRQLQYKKDAKIQYFKQFRSPTMDCAVLNTVFEDTVRHVSKCLETGGGHFEHYLILSVL